jgi:alpha-galactosidase
LPDGLKVEDTTGRILGVINEPGEHVITLHAKNAVGETTRKLKIVVGDTISLTPPMGWNHYNAFGTRITQEQVSAQAHAMVSTGLINHGWTYINVDDGWQGPRGGKYNAIQPDPTRFKDMQALSDEIHSLGLKFGLYSTPWIESYGRRIGGSADNPQGDFTPTKVTPRPPRNKKITPYTIGKYTFYEQDAKQFAEWGIDYLKYDWNPIEIPETKAEYEILRDSGRDIVLSLSNSAPFSGQNGGAADWAKWSNAWRTGGDIRDTWERGVKSRIFAQDKWAPFAGPGHWNDPDMMVLGVVNFGGQHPTKLTPDEQYTHMSAWCLLSVPLLLGCDMTKLDDFTLGLLTNDEVIAVNQDPLGKQAVVVRGERDAGNFVTGVLAKEMADGSHALGLFNTKDGESTTVTVKWSDLNINGKQVVRDLWRQKDIGEFDGEFTTEVPAHGVVMVKISPAG